SLFRRLRGAREDATGRLLHAWWMAIFAIVFFSTIKRAVYLLPAYPAVALIAARVLASMGAAAGDSTSRLSRIKAYVTASPRRVALTLAVFNLVLILPNPSVWKRQVSYRGMLDFVAAVEAAVPTTKRLFGVPELSNATRVVLAYRLERNVLQLPLSCGRPDDYFLIPAEDVPET